MKRVFLFATVLVLVAPAAIGHEIKFDRHRQGTLKEIGPDRVVLDAANKKQVTLMISNITIVHRSRVVHLNVTDFPTAAWTAQQVVEAFPHDSAPRFLIRDRAGIFGGPFRQRVKAIGLAEVLTTPRSRGRTFSLSA